MKNTKLIVAIATLLIAGSCSAADAFIRPLVIQGSSPASGFGSATGYGAEIGAYVDASKNNELSIGFENSEYSVSSNVFGIADVSADASLTRYLVNYRYHFGKADETVRFFTGPSAGITSASVDVKTHYTTATGVVTLNANATLKPVSLGWTAGATVRLSERCSLLGGYRALWTNSSKVSINNGSVNVDSKITNHFFAGLEFRF